MALFKLVTRRFPPLQAYAFIVGHRDFVDYGYTYTTSLPEGQEGNSIWLLEEEHFEHARKLGELALSDSSFVPKLIEDFYTKSEELLGVASKISKLNLSGMSNAELKNLLSEYFAIYLRMTRHLFTPHYIEIAFTKTIKEWLHSKLVEKESTNPTTDQYFNSLASAAKETNTTAQETRILEIANTISRSTAVSELFTKSPEEIAKELAKVSPEIQHLVDEHYRKYSWLPMINMANQPISIVAVIKSIQNALQGRPSPSEKLQQIHSSNSKLASEEERITSSLSPPDNIGTQITELQEFVFLRTYRMEMYGKSHYLITSLLEEIAKRARLDARRLKYMTHEEILRFLSTGERPSDSELESRLTSYAIIMQDRIIQPVLTGRAAEEAKIQQLGRQETVATKEVAGMPASPGSAIGTVRIVKSPTELYRVNYGDILVTGMTTVEFTPIFTKVAAVVTDEGGATSHAAIVSRELGVPCIVGTGNATSALRDGERVRVDASKGVVMRIESVAARIESK